MPNPSRPAALAFALFSLATFAGAADSFPKAETDALIARLKEHRAKFPSFTADFTEERSSRLLQKPLVTKGTLSFSAPGKFRRELTGDRPSLMVSNGERLWIYYPKFKEAELYVMGQRDFFDDTIAALTAGLNLDNVAAHYRINATREGEGFRFVLSPKSGNVRRVVREIAVVVSPDFVVQRTEATLPKGDRVVTHYRNQEPKALPASTFEFTPPSDANVTQPLGK
jgi:outer membrane lipoprotein carrier protein